MAAARRTERDEATEGNSGRSARFYLSRPCLLSTGDNRRESLPGMLSRLSSAACSHRLPVASESIVLIMPTQSSHTCVQLNFERGESVLTSIAKVHPDAHATTTITTSGRCL